MHIPPSVCFSQKKSIAITAGQKLQTHTVHFTQFERLRCPLLTVIDPGRLLNTQVDRSQFTALHCGLRLDILGGMPECADFLAILGVFLWRSGHLYCIGAALMCRFSRCETFRRKENGFLGVIIAVIYIWFFIPIEVLVYLCHAGWPPSWPSAAVTGARAVPPDGRHGGRAGGAATARELAAGPRVGGPAPATPATQTRATKPSQMQQQSRHNPTSCVVLDPQL